MRVLILRASLPAAKGMAHIIRFGSRKGIPEQASGKLIHYAHQHRARLAAINQEDHTMTA